MEPIPEVEALRAQLQLRHIQHVEIELNLIQTFLGMGQVEYSMGERNAGAKSIAHAHQAVAGARGGIRRIDSPEHRASLGALTDKRESEVHRFEDKLSSAQT